MATTTKKPAPKTATKQVKKAFTSNDVMVAPAPRALTAQEKKERDRYQAEDDLRTLQRFHELKSDGARMKRVETHVKNTMGIVQMAKSKTGAKK